MSHRDDEEILYECECFRVVRFVDDEGSANVSISFFDHGVDLYANVVFTTPAFARQHPDTVRGFVTATIQSWRNAAADPDAAIAALKRAEPLSDPAVEIVRLKWALEFVMTPQVRQAGMGNVDPARLSKHIEIVTDGFQLPRKLSPETVFDSSFLPPAADRQVVR